MRNAFGNILWISAFLILQLSTLRADQERLPASKPNVVLIVIDTLRADHLSYHGYTRPTSPFIDSLAAQGVVFLNNYSTSSWTAPGSASIHTSLHPLQHGLRLGLNATKKLMKKDKTVRLARIPNSATTIGEIFKTAGYRTFAITDNANISEERGFSAGYDHFENYKHNSAKKVNKTLLEWREKILTARPYFLYLHYMDPHAPYNRRKALLPIEKEGRWSDVDGYDSEIRFVDEKIKEAYQKLGWSTDTLLILTSDHGEEFGDHGGSGHGHNLHRESLHVPLLFYSSQEQFKPQRVTAPTSVLDIVPTVRALVELPSDSENAGVSLAAIIQGGNALNRSRSFAADLYREKPSGEYIERKAVTTGDFKFMRNLNRDTKSNKDRKPPKEWLFDLERDPLEHHSVLEQQQPKAAALSDWLASYEKNLKRLPTEYFSGALKPCGKECKGDE